ncbi:YolD-like family protein [Metabacillus halosaccharovorans]|uniref:YolD-like family protein n=1 Tax=Metabacillus halosaccharovorans TaxID=930124 RepID=UPI00203DE06E|nr:YolD-like family protein [Metabacillus halosaccharovorans]MCM3440892.1 YolD-like family protein [Metabacillus halosaccharovorans]
MIRDRGNIKWTSMMLPEHVKLLRDWSEEDTYQERPELDEQQLEQFNETICMAMEEHMELVFTYYKDHFFHTCSGYVHYIDPIRHILRIVDEQPGNQLTLPLHDIIDVKQK